MKGRARTVHTLLLVAAVGACSGEPQRTEPQAPEMPVLLHQAWERTVQEHGAAGAEAHFAAMQERNAQLKSALRTRDLDRVRAAQHALRAEQVRLVAATLGADGPRQVLDAVGTLIAELHTRIDAAERDGHSVTRLNDMLAHAEAVRTEATATLAAGEHERSLTLALEAVEIVTSARVAARSL